MTTADTLPPRPVASPIMYQDWEILTFLHWRYDPDVLQRYLPPGLLIDVFDESAWLGVTPFRVANLRPPGLPAVPWLSTFPETNVRTYVRSSDGERGIWFFSLEADRLPAVLGARTVYGLPYRWAGMRVETRGNTVEYRSRRNVPWRPAQSLIRIRIGEPITPSDLEVFLTARFRLYSNVYGKLAYADVEHEPWPLCRAELITLDQSLIEGCGLPAPRHHPLLHYSPGVHTRIGPPRTYAIRANPRPSRV